MKSIIIKTVHNNLEYHHGNSRFSLPLLQLDMINLNSAASWFHSDELEEMDGAATVVPRTSELMNIQAVTQLEKDTILVCYDSE